MCDQKKKNESIVSHVKFNAKAMLFTSFGFLLFICHFTLSFFMLSVLNDYMSFHFIYDSDYMSHKTKNLQ